MSSELYNFYKFTETQPVSWNINKTSYCVETVCDECILHSYCESGENTGLTKDDIAFVKQNNPEYFI